MGVRTFMRLKSVMGGIKIGPGKCVFWGTIGSSVLFSDFLAFFFGGAIWGGSPVLGAGTHYM
jgi:hypothetical protein